MRKAIKISLVYFDSIKEHDIQPIPYKLNKLQPCLVKVLFVFLFFVFSFLKLT